MVFFLRGQICLKIILVIHLFEALETLLRGDAALAVHKVDENVVGALRNSVKGKTSLLVEATAIGQFLPEVVDAVQELASLAILAIALLMELRANFSLVVAGQVRLLLELVTRVSERALVAVVAASKLLHVAAHLSFSHLDDLLVEHLALLLGLEVSLALARASGVDASVGHLHEVLVATINFNDWRT